MGYRVAVVGATGAVGRQLLAGLAESSVPVDEVFALASARSAGKSVSFGEDDTVKVQDLAKFDFSKADIGLFSPGASVSAEFAPKAGEAGCIVIDNTSKFRMDPDVPLVVPEVNPDAIAGYTARNIISNPNCSTIQLVVALKPLHDIVPIRRVVVSTYQSVSGAGQEGMDELFNQTKAIYQVQEYKPKKMPHRIAFNVIPQIDVLMPDGSYKEEWKMVEETKKILDPAIQVIATCVRVPVFVGHSEAVYVEFEEEITVEEARDALDNAPGVVVLDRPEENVYAMPVDCAGEDAVYVSRIRRDPTVPHGIAMWVVSDNLRKGAATNAVQIAEALVETYL